MHESIPSAWNTHDRTTFDGLFDKGATFVNRFAYYIQNVDEKLFEVFIASIGAEGDRRLR